MAAKRRAKKVGDGNGRVFLSGGFPAGSKVGLYERRGDVFSGALPLVAEAEVREDSTVEFTGLEDGVSFWVVGEVEGVRRERAATAKAGVPSDKKVDRRSQAVRLAEAPSQRFQREAGHTTSGVRTTADSRVRGHVKHPDAPALEQDATFVGRQDGVRALGDPDGPDGPLASDTLQGQAFPADGGRLQQEDVHPDVVQASSTETGDAAPVQTYPQQDDVPAGVVQSSATELGDASPIDAPVVEDGVPDKALVGVDLETAQGRLKEEALQKPARKREAAKRSRRARKPAGKGRVGGLTAAQRSARSKKAAATRKRNAKKAG